MPNSPPFACATVTMRSTSGPEFVATRQCAFAAASASLPRVVSRSSASIAATAPAESPSASR
ncbi:MAG: hypothetical protein F4187_04505 [Gemmatimonadetes bacterium]|nr:hypothetical protein [Gemmatimonadota bacterium]